MSGVNKAIIVGNLGADPDLRHVPGGQAVCELRVATTESRKDKDGQRKDLTEWHRVVVWGKTAEACAKYLAKGRMVYVEGRIQTRSYDDKEGQKRYITEIVASDVQFLGGGGGNREASGDLESSGQVTGGKSGRIDDDIPF